jgi:hypothetical protein
MLEAETAREQRRPETSASTSETTPVKVKKLGHLVFTLSDIRPIRYKPYAISQPERGDSTQPSAMLRAIRI